MAIVLGTNAGFVTTAPTGDPTAIGGLGDDVVVATRDTSPATAIKITEIGWWTDDESEEINFEIGLYDATETDGKPGALLEVERTNTHGGSAGWTRVTGLNWTISSSTDYWLSVQIDNTASTTGIDRITSGNSGFAILNAPQTTLPDPFGSPVFDADGAFAIYAIWEAAVPAGGKGGVSQASVI